MIAVTGNLAYLGVTTFDLRRIDSMLPPPDGLSVAARPAAPGYGPARRIGSVEAVTFDRYGVVSAVLAVTEDAWANLVTDPSDPAAAARATFDVGPVTWAASTAEGSEVVVAHRARLLAVYLSPVPATRPGEIDREQLWPGDSLFRKVAP